MQNLRVPCLYRYLVTIGLCLAAIAFPARATLTVPPPKDMAEAHLWLKKGLEEAYAHDVTFEDTPNHVVQPPYISFVPRGGDRTMLVPAFVSEVSFGQKPETGEFLVHFSEEGQGPGMWVGSNSRSDAEHLCQALLFIVRQAQKDWDADVAAALKDFKPKADAWRALAVKPEIPANAKAHHLESEAGTRENDLPKAVGEERYAAALYPLWPEAQRRCAELAAAQGMYRVAVVHMERYLLLSPDAPDALSVKAKIAAWKDQETRP